MKRIALLIKQTPFVEDDNFLRFLPALKQHGYSVDLLSVDSLRLNNNQVEAAGSLDVPLLSAGDKWPAPEFQVLDHDLVWLLGLGERATFLDKFQLLQVVSRATRLINSPDAIMHLKSKYLLAAQNEFQVPETFADTSADHLADIISNKGGDWILKPPAGSLGQDVYRVSSDDKNIHELLERIFAGSTGYAMLQRYLPEIEQGEKRVLMAGGKVISQYRRMTESGQTTNLAQGATAEACELTREEQALCERLAGYLLKEGAWFCGVDLAFPWLIEVNVINPGGIVTIDGLTGRDWSPEVVDAVLAALP